MTLAISDSLSLPIEAVTQKFSFLGRTGSGKSYGATKLCELMLQAGAQVVALDPVGVWWGLRTGRQGFKIPVFGGLHGDLPLDEYAGALIADLIVDRNLSAVLDVSQMVSAQQRRFATAFITQLFQRKKAAPAAMHLFIEECQEFVPQNVRSGEQAMVHEFERLIKLGRNFGIGASLISQRPQEVNKKALNQTECLFAFQMTGPQERKAIESWVSEKGATDNIVDQLPKLKVGEPHVWSPQWLGISKTIRIAKKRTADVSSTPRPGEVRASAQELSKVDLQELREKLAATVEKAKADDPKELRKRIEELERREFELMKRAPSLTEDEKEWLGRHLTNLDDHIAHVMAIATDLANARQQIAVLKNANMQIRSYDLHTSAPTISHPQRTVPTKPAPRQRPPATFGHGNQASACEIGGGIRRMMIALAQRPGLSARQLGVRASLSSSSGTFGTYLAKLRTNGWMEGDRNSMQLTPSGINALGAFDPLPEGKALLNHWLAELGAGSGASRMLEALANEYPRALSKEELGRNARISHTSGTFGTYLSKLRTLELVEGSQEIRASAEFFTS